MKYKDYVAERNRIAVWSKPEHAGVAARAWSESVAAASTSKVQQAAFTIDFGGSSVTINTAGEEYTPPEKEPVESADGKVYVPRPSSLPAGIHLVTDIPIGSAPTNKMVGGFRVPCGLVLIIGGGSTGKTPLAHALAGASNSDYEVVRYGEPLAGYLSDERLGALDLGQKMFSHTDVVLDSIKDVLALVSGGAMKSGISRGALPLLSRLGATAASMGRTLYVPLNPSSPDDDLLKLLQEASKSNSTTSIFYDSVGRWSYVSRGGEGLVREHGEILTSFDAAGSMIISGANQSSDEMPRGHNSMKDTPIVLSDSMYGTLMRRAIDVSNSPE